MIIDTNAFIGSWPFFPHPARTGPQLAAHLAAHGIGRALVSHLDALFWPDPMPANRELFAAARAAPRLSAVPVINPALATWREHLAECLGAGRPRAVRIWPAYHNYTLRHRNLAGLSEAVGQADVRLIVGVRAEDERNRYFALAIKPVPLAELDGFLGRFPRLHPLLAGLYWPEIAELARGHANFSAELCLAEGLDTLSVLRPAISARRLMAGTNTPLLSTRAQAAKITQARQPARVKALIASENARRFFAL